MTDRHDLIAYLATLATLIVVFIAALVGASLHPELIGKMEIFGLGTITGGLIGILRVPTQREVKVANDASDPVPVEPAA